jgi:CheY-like chemotaxis protein
MLEAVNGEEAVGLAAAFKPNLILMDMKMPVMDGYTAVARIRQEKTLSAIPVIAITASAMKEDEQRIRSLCDGYLRKPVNKTDLIFEMCKYLKYSRTSGPECPKPAFSKLRPVITCDTGELITYIEKQFYPKWLELKEILYIDALDAFAEDVRQAAESAGYFPLIQWAKRMTLRISALDVEGIQTVMKDFPALREELKTGAGGTDEPK